MAHAARFSWFTNVYALGRCFALLVLLIGLLLVAPLFPHGLKDEPPAVMRGLNVLVFVAALYAVSSKRSTLLIAAILAVPAFITHLGSERAGAGEGLLEELRIPSGLLFNAFACAVIMRFTIRPDRHVSHRLSGAACAYLLLGFTFAHAYALMDNLAGPALNYNGQPAADLSWMDFEYYSMMTLTTTGYGDFAPRLPMAQAVASIESVIGVLFVAVFISALVGEAAALRSPAPSRS